MVNSRTNRTRLVVVITALLQASCSFAVRNTAKPGERPPLNQLWANPGDLSRRDLFRGPREVPRPRSLTFTFVALDTTGASPGFDVTSADGADWSVKMGVEAQPEVAVSHLLWGVGFHQPPTFYIERWTLAGGPKAGVQEAARFRPDIPGYHVVDEWSWFANPFVGTQAYDGLIALNILLNNWDFKTSNNKIYEREDGRRGGLARMYVVRDLGASLGHTSQPALLSATGFIRSMQGSKNDIDDFESQGYVTLGDDNRPRFDYKGSNKDLVGSVGVAGVVWASRLMSRLSDRQMNDAFRAAGYTPEVGQRFVRKIRQKLSEGLALAPNSRDIRATPTGGN